MDLFPFHGINEKDELAKSWKNVKTRLEDEIVN